MMKRKILFVLLALTASFILAQGTAWAVVQYLSDGAAQNNQGGFDLPTQGTCPAGSLNGYTGIDTRPECTALRLNPAGGCVSPNYSSTTSGVCNDLINNTMALCNGQPDRLWNPGTNICSIVMLDDDRNNVTCAKHQGTWVTTSTCTGAWVFQAANTYVPPLVTGTSPGDQCLRCHNTRTQYNSPRVRDTEDTMFMGHKNMIRMVVPGSGKGWGGPPFHCLGAAGNAEEECYDNGGNWVPVALYPSTDTGQTFDWLAGTVDHDNSSGTPNKQVYWIYGDWLSALPRVIYSDSPNTLVTPNAPKVSYSCARCHSTGWTSDPGLTPNYGAGGVGTSTREPEKSFPGITWNGVANATTGQVNLASGVSGDANKMASWDVNGISCTRCHSSAIDRTNTGTTGFSAPTGMSSHHSDLTSVDVASGAGYCTDTRFTGAQAVAQPLCDSAGAAWLTACSIAGACSDGVSQTSGECFAAGQTWTRYDTQNSCVSNAGTWYGTGCVNDTTGTLTTQALCQGAGKTWVGLTCSSPNFTSQSTCEAVPANWYDSRCSVQGVCNNPLYTDGVTCRANGAQWQVATDIIRCDDAGGRWTGSKSQRGMAIVGLCMGCHRQETSGKPYDDPNSTPSDKLRVGPYHGTVTFLSHPHANQFLNSPHAEFSATAKFKQVATGKFGAEYKSDFMDLAEAKQTGNGCTGCHDVHESTVVGEEPFENTCVDCHSSSEHSSDVPQINLATINHLSGAGTPLEEAGTEPSEPCIVCHMPAGQHSWRINTAASYKTFPASALSATVNANTSPDGTYNNAVWVDLDAACGQCHGGGLAQKTTTGSITAGSATLTVANSTGFTVGEKIRIPGAGSLYYDDDGVSKLTNDFDTYIKLVSPGVITLAGNATTTVNGVAITQNATKNNAIYRTRSVLATVAAGMHGSAGVNYPVTFSFAIGNPNTLHVTTTAVVNCGGECPSFDYDWDWGDNTSHGTGNPGNHDYASGGSKTVKLVVKWNGKEVGSITRSATLTNPDGKPTAAGTCNPNANNWFMNVVDASLDDGPDADTSNDASPTLTITVDWGDGSAKSTGPRGTSFNHTYIKTGQFTASLTAKDAKLQTSNPAFTCPVINIQYFTINGTVTRLNGTTAVGTASVQLMQGATVIKTVTSASNGTFSFTLLKAGTYGIKVTKTGLTFPAPGTPVTNPNVQVGPSKTAGDGTGKIRSTT